MKKLFADFKKFITRGNVVDMAVGVAVAGAFTKIVNAFTNGFISPLLALFSKDANLADFKWILREAVTHVDEAGLEVVDTPEVAILWGSFVQTIIDFLIIALALFIVMRVFNHAMTKAKEAAAELKEELKSDSVKAAEEAAAKAEAEKKAAEEAAAKAAAEAAAKEAAEKQAAQLANAENSTKLLEEIRDLLKAQK
ncbi:MAG: large conductance mechanosensitive channel protein MscL [Clostridia bacterium]|nr:large conductance mechanosensitive channel protein MscL [Clostridia bacterium]